MMEMEDKTVPFLETLRHRQEPGIGFSTYKKSTNLDDFIRLVSALSENTKTGVLIGSSRTQSVSSDRNI